MRVTRMILPLKRLFRRHGHATLNIIILRDVTVTQYLK
jgi:hypothetical protein